MSWFYNGNTGTGTAASHKKKLFVAVLGKNQFRLVGLRFVCWFYAGTPKGSPKVILWRSRESNLRPLVYKA